MTASRAIGECYDEPVARQPLSRARTAVAWMATNIEQQQEHVAKGYYPHKHNLFRWPTGLADGLARKEPALPTVSPWDSPQQLGSPVP